jgi:hypothetical protein
MKCLQNSRTITSTVAILAFLPVLAAPAAAAEIDDLKRQVELLTKKIEEVETRQKASAPAPAAIPANVVTGGDVPGSFKLPGTDTSVKISGQVKGDFIYDLSAPPVAGGGDFAVIASAPLEGTVAHGKQGEVRFHAKESRLNVSTFTPTSFGPVKTVIEGDFFDENTSQVLVEPAGNSTSFGLRHAYGEIGPVLGGQTWTNFMDITAYGEKVDFTGPAGRTFIRQGQLRYTHEMASGDLFRIALENPNGDFNGQTDDTLGDNLPDLTANYRVVGNGWHVQLNGLLRQISFESSSAAGAMNDSAIGWGGGLTGSYRLPGSKDRFTFYTVLGDGIGRYLEGGNTLGASLSANGDLDTQFGYGGFATYQHWWSDTIRSNLIGGVSIFDLGAGAPATANENIYSAYANLIWSPVKEVDIGIEYIWGMREVKDGREGEVNRIQVGTRYRF